MQHGHPDGFPPQPAAGQSKVSGMAITSLIMAICLILFGWIPVLGWIVGPIFFILAVVFGIVALVQIKNSHGALRGKGLAITGIVLAAIMPFIIVLSAVVFVLVSDLGEDGTPDQPAIQFQELQASDRLRVSSAADDADWMDIQVSWIGECTMTLGKDGTSTSLSNGEAVSSTSRMVTAGDVLNVFVSEGSCTVTVTHEPSDEDYGTWTFS